MSSIGLPLNVGPVVPAFGRPLPAAGEGAKGAVDGCGRVALSPPEVERLMAVADLAWVLPRWEEAFVSYRGILDWTTGSEHGHVAYRLGLLARKGFGTESIDSGVQVDRRHPPANGNQPDTTNYFKVAKDLVLQGAEQGNSEALCDLGHMYENGNAGFEANMKQAVKYYKMAAEKNHPRGQYNLAVMLQQEGNKASAFEYYRLAANAEYPCAQFNLACLYFKENDYKSAIHYFAKASHWGDGDAKKQLAKLFTDPKTIIPRTEFLTEEWKKYFPNLHITCQQAIKEVILVMRKITFSVKDMVVLPELIVILMDEVVRAWPVEMSHFQNLG